jgi:hypothetical protein
MPKIFVCYRRQDSAGVTGRIFDRLKARFGDDSVVMDVDTMPFGVDFREYLTNEVSQCDILLAVIGPRWLAKAHKGREIDNPKDFVRIEIEAALKRQIPVIPVLLDRVEMPAETDLPPSIAPLAFRNAVEVDKGRDFHVHVDRLIKGIERHLRRPEVSTPISLAMEGPAIQAQATRQSKTVPSNFPLPAHNAKPLSAETNPSPIAAQARSNVRWLGGCLAGLLVLTILGFIVYKVTPWPPSGPGVAGQSELPGKSKTTLLTPKKEFTNSLGMTLVRIEPGSFLMGSTKEQIDQLVSVFPEAEREWFDVEQAQHHVAVSRPFYLGTREVTVGQFRQFVDTSGYQTEAEQGGEGSYGWDEAKKT